MKTISRVLSLVVGAGALAVGVATQLADAQSLVTGHTAGMNLAMGQPAEKALEGADCASGISISIEFGDLCSDPCIEDAQCPTGWGCKRIEEGNGEFIGLCVPRRINVQTQP